ncbi:class II aldolase/adducin family protein [Marinobacter nanhaiticus D15-8W]|uniref:Class II aldolase/adducin family protein n=1 Tax=Marinobacter nanhaiticus D15-8W TaxID=626887 RepID=N6WXD4_9GAMM|nr:class II aldolase/adducin family protein [Marinobacter nanhaiticus D15-8W]
MPSKKEKVSAEEWQLRVDLAAAYRLIALHGWDDLIFTHISARIPGDEHHFLINPYGMMFEEITASSLVRVDQEANKLDPDDYDINPAGFTIHSAIHAVREDAACVMHTHTTAGVAVSAQKDGLLPLSQQSLFPLSNLAYHDYEGVALREDEKARLQADLGESNFMILRNHGLLTVGSSIADAFLGMFILQRACEIQIGALAGNRELTPIPGGIVDTIKQQAAQVTKGMGGNLAWPGLLRKLDRIDPSFRE